jgi:Fe2+ or Zn2+ uptake regulation protein
MNSMKSNSDEKREKVTTTLRKSAARHRIQEVFKDSARPLSANEIRQRLEARGIVFNKTTIYREIETLKRIGAVKELFLRNDSAMYELSGTHHHHLQCVSCGDVRHVRLEETLEHEQRKMAAREGYTITDHSLEFFGVCAKCEKG